MAELPVPAVKMGAAVPYIDLVPEGYLAVLWDVTVILQLAENDGTACNPYLDDGYPP
jgi:hypothetical protein